MKLEIGKRYVLRNGEVTGPLRQNNLHPFSFFCDESSYSWKEDGGYLNDFEHPHDIVSEYIEPQPASQSPPPGYRLLRYEEYEQRQQPEAMYLHDGQWKTIACVSPEYFRDCPYAIPIEPQPSPAIDPGEGWRLLEPGELIQDGDEFKVDRGWIPTGNPGDTVRMNHYRRRIPQPSPPNEIQQLRDQCKRQEAVIRELQKTIDVKAEVINSQDNQLARLAEKVREQDKRYAEAQSMAAWQQKEIDSLTSRNQNQLKVIDGLRAELAEKAQQLDAMHAMRDVLIDQVAKLEAQAKPLLQSAIHEQAKAWMAVANLLDELSPGWTTACHHSTATENACHAIRELASNQTKIEAAELLAAEYKMRCEQLQANQAKPLQWERRLPTQEECKTSWIIVADEADCYRPDMLTPLDFNDTQEICILPAILPAVEPPKPVIERLWVWSDGKAFGAQHHITWKEEGITPWPYDSRDKWTWHRTDTTREKPQ